MNIRLLIGPIRISRPGQLAVALAAVLAIPLALSSADAADSRPNRQEAATDEGELLRRALQDFNSSARFPLPTLTAAQLERLRTGKVVKIRQVSEDRDEPQRAIGLLRTGQSAAGLWLSARDVHFTAVDELTEVQLTPDGQWPAVWYQHLDLPRPFTDRHWVLDVVDTHALASATGGRCWEHAWVLSEDGPQTAVDAVAAGRVPGIDSARAAKAIYTPANHGAWLVVALGDGTTVLGYHVTSVIGGAIPDKLVADYTLLTLGRLLRGVVQRTGQVLEHYDAAHVPIEGGDGVAIPPRPRGQSRARPNSPSPLNPVR